ncbi:hypothetical protein C8R45DRAFT_972166 [Mycena sanguinolenta]|nr:hypothetical protein C8R45DRAFT_972166 [Mycena sanguinolenta]
MKIFQRLISIAALVAVSIDARPLSKRVLGGMYVSRAIWNTSRDKSHRTLCTDINFIGYCLHMDLADSKWTNITDPGLVGQVSSIKPDNEPHDCLISTSSTTFTILVPNSGFSNLGSLGVDNSVVAVQCQW